MDLPAGAGVTALQQTIEIICCVLKALVRTDVTGRQSLANGQQLHSTSAVCPQLSLRL